MRIPFETLAADVRYALRGMRRSPGFTAVAVMTLAIALGINTGVFTIAGTVLLGGYPGVDPDNRILYTPVGPISNAEFEDWKAQTKSFSGMAGVADGGLRLVLQSDSAGGDSGNAETCDTTQLTTNAFQVLGQKPILGRDFAPSDGAPGAPSVALLNYAFWERRFGKDPSVIGKSFRLGDHPVTVIGVMPAGLTFPTPRVDLWIQIVPETARPMFLWFAFGRLARGATRESAQTEMDAIGRRLAGAYPQATRIPRRLRTFGEQFLGVNAMELYRVIWCAVGFVLLIGCANLANLLLARAIGRYREISLRMALGAGRWRIMRQLLIESWMLSSFAAVLAWFIAVAGVRIYERMEAPPGSYIQYQFVLDHRVFLYLAAVSILAAILFGLAPAVRLAGLDLNSALKEGGRGAAGSRSGRRLSALLVTAEVAVTIVLLAGAGLMARSFLNVYTEDIGVDARNILAASVSLPATRYPDVQSRMAFFDRITTKLKNVPGVESVALADSLPGLDAHPLPYELEGSPPPDGSRRPMSFVMTISPNYFRTVGAAVLSGRDFSDFDRESMPAVALVNEQFARAHWPGASAVGRRLRLYDFYGRKAGAWLTIAGVTSNIVQTYAGGEPPGGIVYVPYRQDPAAGMNILLSTRVRPESLAVSVRREIQAMDSRLDIGPGLPAPAIEGPLSLAQRLKMDRYWSRALNAGLLLVFAVIALLLAAIGLYAVIAHAVSRATQEIGVRVALGATSRNIRFLVLRQGMRPVVSGLIAGLAASAGFDRLLRSQLFLVSSTDPATYAATCLVLIAAALAACLIPAQRAMRVDPAVALRHE